MGTLCVTISTRWTAIFYSLSKFTYTGFTPAEILKSLKAGEMPTASNTKNSGPSPAIRFNFRCGFTTCPVAKQWVLKDVRKHGGGPLGSANDGSVKAIDCKDYEVVFDQIKRKNDGHHRHDKTEGGHQSRTELKYDAFNPTVTFNKGRAEPDETMEAVRCNFAMLPPEKLPPRHLLRLPDQSTAQLGSFQPTQQAIGHLHTQTAMHGQNVLTNSTLDYTISQVKGNSPLSV